MQKIERVKNDLIDKRINCDKLKKLKSWVVSRSHKPSSTQRTIEWMMAAPLPFCLLDWMAIPSILDSHENHRVYTFLSHAKTRKSSNVGIEKRGAGCVRYFHSSHFEKRIWEKTKKLLKSSILHAKWEMLFKSHNSIVRVVIKSTSSSLFSTFMLRSSYLFKLRNRKQELQWDVKIEPIFLLNSF